MPIKKTIVGGSGFKMSLATNDFGIVLEGVTFPMMEGGGFKMPLTTNDCGFVLVWFKSVSCLFMSSSHCTQCNLILLGTFSQ